MITDIKSFVYVGNLVWHNFAQSIFKQQKKAWLILFFPFVESPATPYSYTSPQCNNTKKTCTQMHIELACPIYSVLWENQIIIFVYLVIINHSKPCTKNLLFINCLLKNQQRCYVYFQNLYCFICEFMLYKFNKCQLNFGSIYINIMYKN